MAATATSSPKISAPSRDALVGADNERTPLVAGGDQREGDVASGLGAKGDVLGRGRDVLQLSAAGLPVPARRTGLHVPAHPALYVGRQVGLTSSMTLPTKAIWRLANATESATDSLVYEDVGGSLGSSGDRWPQHWPVARGRSGGCCRRSAGAHRTGTDHFTEPVAASNREKFRWSSSTTLCSSVALLDPRSTVTVLAHTSAGRTVTINFTLVTDLETDESISDESTYSNVHGRDPSLFLLESE